jgi:competence ComEA-like helix-hairpin-helix protein
METHHLKRFFTEITDFSKKEFIFILSVIFLVAVIKIGAYFYTNQTKSYSFEVIERPKNAFENFEEKDFYENKKSYSNNRWDKANLFTFDPNTIDEQGLLKIGFSPKVAKIFLNYRNKGGRFKTKEDVSKVFGVSPKLYQHIENHIYINPKNMVSPAVSKPSFENTIIDINKANVAQLKSLYGIGNYYAQKIVETREKIGSYINVEQFRFVCRMPDSTFDKMKSRITLTPSVIKKININKASKEDLESHPFIAKWQVEDILKNRPIYGEADLLELYTFKNPKYRNAMPYFDY